MIDKAWVDLKLKLNKHPKRINHTKGVVESVVKLSNHYNVYSNDLVVAAIYHDYFKYDDIKDLKEYISFYKRLKYRKYPFLYHAYASYKYVIKKYPNLNKTATLAIKNHVFGRPKMSIDEKILFVSDYLDGNREFIDYNKLMNIALNNLDKAVVYCLESTISYLKKNNEKLHIRQIMSYNYYKKEVV